MRLSPLAAFAILAAAILPAAAQAELVTPETVTPEVVRPHVVTAPEESSAPKATEAPAAPAPVIDAAPIAEPAASEPAEPEHSAEDGPVGSTACIDGRPCVATQPVPTDANVFTLNVELLVINYLVNPISNLVERLTSDSPILFEDAEHPDSTWFPVTPEPAPQQPQPTTAPTPDGADPAGGGSKPTDEDPGKEEE